MKRFLKRISVCLLSLFLLAGGCTTKEEAPVAEATPEPGASQEAEKPSTMVGGWSVYEDNNVYLTDEQRQVFEKAFEGWTGVGYEPLSVLGTQVVAGTNYTFLAKGTTITAIPKVGYYIVTIYENLSGETEILCIKDLDFTNPVVTEDAPETLMGGWAVPTTGKPGMLPEEEIETSFSDATKEHLGVKFNPVALLGTQLVSGMNYCALCTGETVTQNPVAALYLVTWYKDLQGNSKITDVQRLDLTYYVDPSVQ